MKTFLEWLNLMEAGFTREDVRLMVMDALKADPQSSTVDNSPLQDYELKDQILTHENLQSIIAEHPNRGAIMDFIEKADDDPNITVGMLVNAISAGETETVS